MVPALHTTVQTLDTNKNEYRKVKIKINKTYQGYEEKQQEKMDITDTVLPPQISIVPPPPTAQPVPSTQQPLLASVESPKMAVSSPTLQEPRVSIFNLAIKD